MGKIICYEDPTTGKKLNVMCFDREQVERLQQLSMQIRKQSQQPKQRKRQRIYTCVAGIVVSIAVGLSIWFIITF